MIEQRQMQPKLWVGREGLESVTHPLNMLFIMKYTSKKRMEASLLPQLLEYNVVLS